jgi:spore maturation protein CgeB
MMHIAFFGSSLLSSYWNGAATYYRGMLAALAARGWKITFYEPDAFDRQRHRDIDPPRWCEVVVFEADAQAARTALMQASAADVIVKASGIGVLDDDILAGTVALAGRGRVALFWDVDAPATLADMDRDPAHALHAAVPRLDGVLTYGGGAPVIDAYRRVGAKVCVPIYNALDPSTHYPVAPDPRFAADLAFLGNRLPDREKRVDAFFFEAARQLPERRFLLAGSGWETSALPRNVRLIGHLPTSDHNAFNCSPRAVINISRQSMATVGHSPATRVFEAAGAGACLISDRWNGLDEFLTPGEECLVADDGREVALLLESLSPERTRKIGNKALRRILREHTYEQRAEILDTLLGSLVADKKVRAA